MAASFSLKELILLLGPGQFCVPWTLPYLVCSPAHVGPARAEPDLLPTAWRVLGACAAEYGLVCMQIKRNYGFVQYEKVEDATEALRACNHSRLMGE